MSTVSYSNWTSCEEYGHRYYNSVTRRGYKVCTDCGDEYYDGPYIIDAGHFFIVDGTKIPRDIVATMLKTGTEISTIKTIRSAFPHMYIGHIRDVVHHVADFD